MPNDSMIPRPPSLRDIRRDQEDESRRREMTTSARNTSATTIGAGGRLDVVGGDFTVTEGGNAAVRDGGKFLVEGGGSMDITDDGEVVVRGTGEDPFDGRSLEATVSLATREWYSSYSGYTFRIPGIYFGNDIGEGGSLRALSGDSPSLTSGKKPVTSGPLASPGIVSVSGSTVSPSGAELLATASEVDDPEPSGVVATCSMQVQPHAFNMLLRDNQAGSNVGSIGVSFTDDVLRIFGRNGVDIAGPFTVNGQPVGGAPEWTAVKNKPTSFPPSAHSHPTSQVTGLDTALAGKATAAFVNGLKRRFRRVPGTGLGTSIASSTTNWTSFGSTVTVPADLFGVGVPYIITAYAQAAGWPASSAVFSLRLLFSGTQPDGAKTNSPNGPHNATTTVSYDFEVTTSREVIVAAQAQSAFGSSAIGQGADQAFYTVTATPYTAL